MLQRWNQHVYTALKTKAGKGFSHFANAVRAYGKDAFSHEVLEVCRDLEVANLAEECWIEFYDTRNSEKGFNLMRGGEHVPHPIWQNPWDDPEYRAKHLPRTLSIGHTPEARAASKAALNTPECRAMRSALAKASMNSPETMTKRAALRVDGTFNKRIAETLKLTLASDEARARMSEASHASATEDVRKKRSETLRSAMSREETRSAISSSSKASWARPEYVEKMRNRVASAETRAKIAAAGRGKHHSAESIQKQRELYLARSSACKFCDSIIEGKRTCINGRVACFHCCSLHKQKIASFTRPDGSFIGL